MTRRIAPAAAGIPALEPIAQDLYDTKDYVSATTTTLTFFQNPNPGGELFTNMVASGQLPHPQQFHAFGLAVEFIPGAAQANSVGIDETAYSELKKLREQAFLILHIGAKDYLQLPLVRIPTGLSLTGFAAGTSATNLMVFGQGIQDVKHAYELTVPQRGKIKPIHIPAQQSFFVQIRWPDGAVTLATLTENVYVRCYLVGVLWREVQ